MELLKEIFRTEGLKISGKTVHRQAVRGIICNNSKLLMIHVTQNGTFKFPGGGILDGETHSQALAREILEECGMTLALTGPAYGKIIEYAAAYEPDFDVFKMTSYYYYCQVQPIVFAQSLDPYEKELGFQPNWVSGDDALRNNKTAEASDPNGNLFWNRREIFVLESLRNTQDYGMDYTT